MLTLPVLLVSSLVCGAAPADLDNAVLDFTATWCGPCQEMSPVVARLERAGLPIHRVDFDQNHKLARQYGVTRIPAFLLVIDGKVVKHLTGVQSEETLRKLCQRVIPEREARAADDSAPAARPESPPQGERDRKTAAVVRDGGAASSKAGTSSVAGNRGDAILARGQSPEKGTGFAPLVTNQPFPATVRIRVRDAAGDDVGTGTIIFSGDVQTLILTCGHLFKHWDDKTSRLQVEVFERGAGKVIAGRKIAVDFRGDVALISIPSDRPLPCCALAQRGTRPAKGSTLISVGCNGGQPPTLERHKVVALNRYTGPDNLECTGVPVQGRSGGGLFDETGRVVGVCMAEDPHYKDGMYAGLEPVYRLIGRSQLAHLFPQRDQSASGMEDDAADGEDEADDDPVELVAQADSPMDEALPDDPEVELAGLDEPEEEPEPPTTERMLRKALKQARRGDLVCLIPDAERSQGVAAVLVIHDPDDDLRRTLAGGPEAGATRATSFRGIPPVEVQRAVRAQNNSRPRPRSVREEELPVEPRSALPDEEQSAPPGVAARNRRGDTRTSALEDTPAPFRRGRAMSLRGDTR